MKDYDPNYVDKKVYAMVGGKSVVFNAEGKVLILRRSDKNKIRPGGYDFPGGGLNRGENPIEGVKREIYEETGLEATDVKPIDVVSFINDEEDFIVVVGYQATVSSTEVALSWEHDQYQWLSYEEALNLPLPDRHKQFLKKSQSSP